MADKSMLSPETGSQFARMLGEYGEQLFTLPSLDAPFRPDPMSAVQPTTNGAISSILAISGVVLTQPPQECVVNFPVDDRPLPETLSYTFLS